MTSLTHAERERLIKLNEELNESIERLGALIQAMGKANQTVCKTLLHGYEASFEGVDYDNRDDLMRELGDVGAVIDLMVDCGDVSRLKIDRYQLNKSDKLIHLLKHQNGSS